MKLTEMHINDIRGVLTDPNVLNLQPPIAIADSVTEADGKFVATKSYLLFVVADEFRQRTGSQQTYAELLKDEIEKRFPIEVSLLRIDDRSGNYIVEFELVDTLGLLDD